MTFSENTLLDLVQQAGFKVFKNGLIVAADGGSSGNASQCARKLIELVAQRCAEQPAEPSPRDPALSE